jgi:hypothetical protein
MKMEHSEQPKVRSVPALKGSIGLFISPHGEVFEVEQSHINTVILYPARFGITTHEIESAYANYKEPVGVEGAARGEILRDLVMHGWIRLRRYIKPQQQWSVTVNELNDRTRLFLHDWAGKILAGKMGFREDDPHKPVVITELASGKIHYSSILEVASLNLPPQGTDTRFFF